jgi:pimeloyl-ACP methyl ester carboxylesterase
MAVTFPRKEVVAAGIRLQYIERLPDAPSTKAPVLLLHGLLATVEAEAVLISLLPNDRRIVAIDLLSATPVDPGESLPVHFDSLATLISAFAHEVGVQNPILLGHSHGGALSLQIAAFNSMPVSGLALMCPAHPFGGYRAHVVRFYLKRHGRALALCIPFAPRWAILNAYNDAAGPDRPLTYIQLAHYMRILRSRKALKRVLTMLQTWEEDMLQLSQSLQHSAITQPTLLIWGDADTIVPLDSAAELAQHLVSSELKVLPTKGHLLAEEAPRQVTKLINDWLNSKA